MQSHDVAIEISKHSDADDLNEADTRHQIIDRVLHEVLLWPRGQVKCEDYIRPGYADYVLERAAGRRELLIEAKRQGHFFSLPSNLIASKRSAYIKMRTLLTDDAINDAVCQVQTYCATCGCETAAVTNGQQWIFFRTFQVGEDWRDLKAFVIDGLQYFAAEYTAAINHLSYQSIVERGSLRRLLLGDPTHNRDLFYPKSRVTSYEAKVDANSHASSLRPIMNRYFGVIDESDATFMDRCYVSDREYDAAFLNAGRRIEDSVTPYLARFNIQDFQDTEGGGKLGNRVQKPLLQAKRADVVVLFGGKGVGKSTFLRRRLFYTPPQVVKKHATIAYVDLLNTPPDEVNAELIWRKVVVAIDEDELLKGDRDKLCLLFSDRYEEAQKQDLFGLSKESTEYNVRLNDLVRTWKADARYAADRLSQTLSRKHRAVIVVLDNTDQYPDKLQDACFAIAQDISSELGCLAIISMREERFFASSIHGVLDAYQNSGFHITSPLPREVFLRRIKYVRLLVEERVVPRDDLPANLDRQMALVLLRLFEREFRSSESHLASFLVACSHGNIRMALELFRDFVVSGYTNIGEMTAIETWKLQVHQVIKPFMIPSRFFYEEQSSRIPNLFQIRSKAHGSHFTALRILSLLSASQDTRSQAFAPVSQIADIFVSVFSMKEDFELNLDLLLQHRLVEADNRLESFSSSVDSVRTTAYGMYMLGQLSCAFTYIELVCLDCAWADAQLSNEVMTLSNDEYRQFTQSHKIERIRTRLKKADMFITYLEKEEEREVNLYGNPLPTMLTTRLRRAYISQSRAVLKSAVRNYGSGTQQNFGGVDD